MGRTKILALIFLLHSQLVFSQNSLWSDQAGFYTVPFEEAVGFYTRGSLRNASSLENEGPGFLKLFQPRNRRFGTEQMITLIESAATQLEAAFPGRERLQVGDTAAERGGHISGHGSHQNGLDADLAFLRRNHREQDPMRTDGFDELFVRNSRVTDNFDTERNYFLLRAIVQTGAVNRIFMDQVIKQALCQYSASLGNRQTDVEFLRRLRPWKNHKDHFHLRLVCPSTSPNCQQQEAPPAGSGC